jgi:hypothetical protein
MSEIKKFGLGAFALYGLFYLVAMWFNSRIKIWNGDHDMVIDFGVMSNNWTAIMVMAFFGLALPMVVLGFAWRHYAKINSIVLTLRQKVLMIGVGLFAVGFIGVSIDNAVEGNLLNLSGFGEISRIYIYNLIGQIMLLGFAWVAFKIGTSKRPAISNSDWTFRTRKNWPFNDGETRPLPNTMQAWADEVSDEHNELDDQWDRPPTGTSRLDWGETVSAS